MSANISNIYDLLEVIRQRPSMYLRDKSLADIELYLCGYIACLEIHKIDESGCNRAFDPRDFANWLYETRGWSGCAGFAHAINEHTNSPDEAFDHFFELVSEYRTA